MEQLTRPWSARTLRLTVFLQSPTEAIASDAWARATNGRPTIDQNLPQQMTRLVGGPIGPGFLNLQTQSMASRLDWIMVPPPPDSPEIVPAYEFGPVEAALSAFNNVVRNWLAGTDVTSNRLAVGVIAVIPMPDIPTAYNTLQEYLPSVRIDAEHTRDFTYMINRPKPSRSLGPDVELNRLTRWGALVIRTLGVAGTRPVRGVGALYASVECDNSTPDESESPIDNSKFVDIYDELMEMALQNLERGELP